MTAYIDTSFLISLYSPDANSVAAAHTIQNSKHVHLVSTLAELEAINALQLRIFRKEISRKEEQSSLRNFRRDLSHGVFRLVRLPDEAFHSAHQIARRTTARLGTRTADLLHIAAALELNADSFYSFDKQQRKLARTLRLNLN